MEKNIERVLKDASLKYESVLYDEKLVFKGNFLSVYNNKYKICNKVIDREIGTKKIDKAVVIIPVTMDGKFVLVVQPRVAIKEKIDVEFPAGYIEIGETEIDAAKRELAEETGYVADEYITLDGYYSAEGASGEYLYVVIALDSKKIDKQHLDKDEFIDFFEASLDDVYELIDNNYILGASSRIGLFNYERYLKKVSINDAVRD